MSSAAVRAFLCAVASMLALGVAPSAAQAPPNTIGTRDLSTLTDIDSLSVSPDGRWAAFLTRQGDPDANTYALAWHVIPTGGGAARRIADGGAPISLMLLGMPVGGIMNPAPVWSPDGRWIAYLRRDGDRTHIWRTRIDGRASERLTDTESDARALVFSADGRRIIYQTEPSAPQIAAALAEEGRTGFRYDLRFFPIWRTTPVMPSDASFEGGGGATASQRALRSMLVYDIAREASRPATETEREEFETLARADGLASVHSRLRVRSPSGALAWTEARDPDRQGVLPPHTLVAQPHGASAPAVCAAEACTSQRFVDVWWRNDDEVLFARGVGTQLLQDIELYVWRIGDAAPGLILRTPNPDLQTGAFGWPCAVAQDRLVCFFEEPARPRRLVTIDLDTGAIATLYDPNPAFARFDLGAPPRRLDFRSPSGIESYGYLVLPPGRRAGERLPLVVVTYVCGGFLRGGAGDEYPVFPFAAAGHAVLCFSAPRLDYERVAVEGIAAYVASSRGPGDPEFRRVQEGLESAIAELDRMGIIDPARVGVTGLSFGGEIVSYALWRMPRLGAAIASGTEFGPTTPILGGPVTRTRLIPWGLDRWDSPRWDALSITRNAERVRAPFLLNVPDNEMIGSLHPVVALEQAGRAVEMFVYPDEYHQKWQPAHRLVIYHRNIDWMNFWLRGVESGLSGDATQYERWRAMRERQCALFGPNGSERAPDEAPPWYCRPGALDNVAAH